MPLLTMPKSQPRFISETEAAALDAFLKVLRAPRRWPEEFAHHLKFLVECNETASVEFEPSMIAEALLAAIDQTQPGVVSGSLFSGETDTLEVLDDRESATLRCYLDLERSDFWLSAFIERHIDLYAEGKRYTPLQVLGDLENEVEQFDCAMDTARQMVAMYPEMVGVPSGEQLRTPAAEPSNTSPDSASETHDHDDASERGDAPEPQPAPDSVTMTPEAASKAAPAVLRCLGEMASAGAKLDPEHLTLLRKITTDLSSSAAGEDVARAADVPTLPLAAWADMQIRALEEFAHDCPEALSLDQLNRLAKLARVETAAENPSITAQASRCAHARNHA